jgi:lysozyme family protein
MLNNFDACLAFVLDQEKGYVDNPQDPGGRTNLGVTQKVWEEWVGRESNEKEMRNLTKADVAPLYQRKYWNACRCDELPIGVDLCVFDTAVNSGPGRAIKLLQSCIGVPADGAIGSVTVATITQFKGSSIIHLIDEYCSARQSYLISLPNFGTFGKGWTKRVQDCEQKATSMLG